MLLLLACTGNTGSAPVADSYTGETTFTVVKPEPLESENVLLHFVAVSFIQEDGYAVLAASDDQDAFDLVMRLPAYDGAGTYSPDLVRYRKGQQHLMDASAECTVEITEAGGTFSCEGLTEEGREEPWAITNGIFADGARPELAVRGERFEADGYNLALTLLGDTEISHEGDDAMVVPWRGDETWVFMDDGGDGHPNDVQFRLTAEAGQVTVDKRVREAAAEDIAVLLTLSSATELEVSIEDGETATGTEVEFMLWESLHDTGDTQVLFVK
jgi:hypothetical protein